jgi:acetylornithine deacetylase/succinyl-diaminopimelate desuccinylase-like protein
MKISRRRAFALTTAALLAPQLAHADNEADIVAALAARPEVRAAFAAIEAQRAQANAELVELVQIPAPPFGEERRAARFAEMLRAAGVGDVSIDEVGNVIGRRRGRGRGPTLAIIAHLDTVFPAETDLRVRVEGDTYHAPGIGDNTRGLVYLLVLARAMDAASLNTRGDILFVASVGEEGLGDLRGVRHLFRRGGPRIDAALVIDGGSPGRIVNVAVGSSRYRVTVRGPGGHSWRAFGLGNTHHALGRIIARFDEAAAGVAASSNARATYNVGRISGGTSVNSIPFESSMEVDMRSAEPAAITALEATLRSAAEAGLAEENAARTEGPELTLELESIGQRPAGSAPDQGFVRTAAAAMAQFGVTPDYEASSTDANVPISLGVPAITISRGGVSGSSHALDEWWRDENSHLAPQIGLLIALSKTQLVR